MFVTALLLVSVGLCTSEVNGETFFGRAGARQNALIPLKLRDERRSMLDLPSLRQLTYSGLELRGGSDPDYYKNDYDDPRRRDDYTYEYQNDRGSPYQDSGYGYHGGRGRNDDYYQQDDRRDPYYGEDRYSPRYDDRGSSGSGRSKSMVGNMSSIAKFGNKKVGVMLLGFGALSTVMGITMFFNKTLLRIGNLLFVAGVPMTIGPGRTAGYFFQPKKSRATACLVLGIFLVLSGHPIIGIILEAFGLLNLFGNMFPVAFAVLRQMPFVGNLFGSGGGGRSRKPRRQDDYYDGGGRDQDDDRYY